jgi:hypothetical protein
MAAIFNGGLGCHTIFKGDHPSTIPVKFGLIWFSSVRSFYQNMPNLHNRNKTAERKMSQKNLKYISNYYSLPCTLVAAVLI